MKEGRGRERLDEKGEIIRWEMRNEREKNKKNKIENYSNSVNMNGHYSNFVKEQWFRRTDVSIFSRKNV